MLTWRGTGSCRAESFRARSSASIVALKSLLPANVRPYVSHASADSGAFLREREEARLCAGAITLREARFQRGGPRLDQFAVGRRRGFECLLRFAEPAQAHERVTLPQLAVCPRAAVAGCR